MTDVRPGRRSQAVADDGCDGLVGVSRSREHEYGGLVEVGIRTAASRRRLARPAAGFSPVGQTVVIAGDRSGDVADDFVTVYEVHYPRLVRALEIGGLDRADR